MKRRIEYQFPEFANLVEISDLSIFDKSIPLQEFHAIFMAENTRTHKSVLLGVHKTDRTFPTLELSYLQSWEEDEEEGVFKYEWYYEGEVED
jgi:hypothetical protein